MTSKLMGRHANEAVYRPSEAQKQTGLTGTAGKLRSTF